MSMHVSVGDPLEEFANQKVAQGEYGSVSEVVREGLRLLKRREELWQAGIRAKIEQGMADCEAGRTAPAQQAWSELHAWRDEQKQKPGL